MLFNYAFVNICFFHIGHRIVIFISYSGEFLTLIFFFFNDTPPTEIYPLPLHDPLPISPPHRLENERHRGVAVDRAEPSALRLAANGTMDDGPFALRELEADTERLDDQEDVGEEDRRVDAEAVDGLQRDFGRRLRVPGKLEESVPLAHRPILRQIAAGLPHEPDGSVRRRRPARGAQQECI